MSDDLSAHPLHSELPSIKAFQKGQRVFVLGPHQWGFIDAILDTEDGIQYRVVYWAGPQRFQLWVYPREIATKNPNE